MEDIALALKETSMFFKNVMTSKEHRKAYVLSIMTKWKHDINPVDISSKEGRNRITKNFLIAFHESINHCFFAEENLPTQQVLDDRIHKKGN